MATAGAAERATRYRQEAEKFRQMADVESTGVLRETLLMIATEYDDLAATIEPSKENRPAP